MKKLLLSLTFVAAVFTSSFGQAVADQGVIPVSVTLNQILRLNITSGGNINFVFNTINQYQTGLNVGGGNAQYQTTFTVASSVDYKVSIYAEDGTFMGTDNTANTLALNNVGYFITSDGTFADAAELDITADAIANTAALTAASVACIIPGTGNAGDITDNAFTIDWLCGTSNGAMNAASILSQSMDNDRYTTNVFLVLAKN